MLSSTQNAATGLVLDDKELCEPRHVLVKPSKTEKTKVRGKWYLGGFASACAACCTHPLDLLKVRMQLSKKLGGPVGAGNIVRSIIGGEGVVGLYRGLTASVGRQLSYSTIRFGAYDVLKHRYTPKNGQLDFPTQLLIACSSGALGAFAGNMFDISNIRMQSDYGLPPNQRRNYRNGLHAVYRIIRDEGVLACWTGVGPNIQRGILTTASQIVTYERAKHYLMSSRNFEDNIVTHFCASMLSGVVTVTVTNPIDVVKSTVMSAEKGTYRSGGHAALSILRNHGPFAFLKGWTPSYVRLGPLTVITFLVLEQLRQIPALQVRDEE